MFSHSLKFLFLISFGRVLFESVTYNLYRLLFMCTEDSILHTFCSKLRTFQVARNLSKVAQSMITCYYFRKWATYRVSHVEVCKVNHLWGVEGSISLLNYDAYIVGSRGLEIWVSSTSFQESNISRLASTASDRKDTKFNIIFLDSIFFLFKTSK